MELSEKFEKSNYSAIVGWYLIANGFVAWAAAAWMLMSGLQVINIYSFVLSYALFQVVSVAIGYGVLRKNAKALAWAKWFILASILVLGIGTWDFSLSQGLVLDFKVYLAWVSGNESTDIVAGLNVLPVLFLWLLWKHRNLTRASMSPASRAGAAQS